jgi:hypothetical protein
MSTVYKWRIYCETEGIWVESWGTTAPTTCGNNTTHTINPNSTQEIQSISPNEVFVNTERVPTGGNFRTVGYMREIPACTPGETFVFDVSYPYPINLSLVSFRTDVNSSGDMINGDAAPDTVVGVLTSNAISTTSVLHVSPTVNEYLKVGFYCNIFNGITSYNLGECISNDTVNNTITTERQVPETVSAGSLIRMALRNIDDYVLSNNQYKILGTGKIGASYVPANTILRIHYQNNNGESKRFFIDNEFTY